MCPKYQCLFRFEELKSEFEEYQDSSRELESELETQLSQLENRLVDLQARNEHLTNENELLKCKFEKINSENLNQISLLQEKLNDVTSLNQQLMSHIRDLEQSNDDLERAKRHLDATLLDFDAKLNEQIERNELLESEIGEKEELQFVIQRLKDEARDLRQELMIQENFKSKKSIKSIDSEASPNNATNENSKKTATSIHNNNSATNTNGVVINKLYHDNSCTNLNTLKQSPNQIPLLSASSRISALNIVSDLLRKFGALESKLASCRNITSVSNTIAKNNSLTKTANNSTPDKSPINSAFKDINTNV